MQKHAVKIKNFCLTQLTNTNINGKCNFCFNINLIMTTISLTMSIKSCLLRLLCKFLIRNDEVAITRLNKTNQNFINS